VKNIFFQRLTLVWILTKRDYAIQFAGTKFGLAWMVFQSIALISLYILIFSILNLKSSSNHYIDILSGVLFWIPIQDMILKSSQILVENRNIIKKSKIGISLFLKVPILQFFIHLSLLFLPCLIFFVWLGKLNIFLFILNFFWMLFCVILLYPFISYLSQANVLLKDISPMLRILLQFLFWTLPILYTPSLAWKEILSWNPFYFMLEIFRFLILKDYLPYINWYCVVCFILLSIFFHTFSNKKLTKIVLDQL
jgi:lipopolysaccharide transport system permease protein